MYMCECACVYACMCVCACVCVCMHVCVYACVCVGGGCGVWVLGNTPINVHNSMETWLLGNSYPPNHHLVQEDPTTPPIGRKAVRVSLEDLWGYVLRCACQRLCLLVCA